MQFEHKKSLGQHFLNNTHTPRAMVAAAHVVKGDTVLEIGPGIGALTKELLNAGAKVIAVEADVRAVESLKQGFTNEITAQKLVIVHGDIREIDLVSLGLKTHAFKIVANIPYYLSGFLFRHFLENDRQPSDLVFLVQKEVAERIARDRKESLLSLSVKIFGDPHYVRTVGKGNFTPQPRVDSAILSVTSISRKRLGNISSDFFFLVIHEAFKSKRKQLLGNLAGAFHREELTHIFSTLGLPLGIRGEDVHIDMWLKICHAILSTENAQKIKS